MDKAVIDYLDKPPQRYRLEHGTPLPDSYGAWVKHADMDLYMFEGGQLLQQACARIRELEAALREIAALPGEDLDEHFDQVFHIATVALGSPSRPDNLSPGSALSDGTEHP